jgi:hypothetical protein
MEEFPPPEYIQNFVFLFLYRMKVILISHSYAVIWNTVSRSKRSVTTTTVTFTWFLTLRDHRFFHRSVHDENIPYYFWLKQGTSNFNSSGSWPSLESSEFTADCKQTLQERVMSRWHGGVSLLGCNTVYCYSSLQTFRRNVMSPFFRVARLPDYTRWYSRRPLPSYHPSLREFVWVNKSVSTKWRTRTSFAHISLLIYHRGWTVFTSTLTC